MTSIRLFFLVLLYVLCTGVCLAENTLPQYNSPKLVLTAEEQAWVDAHPVIRVASDPDYAPFQFKNDAGKSVGVANDYLEIISQRLGIRFEYRLPDSWAQALQLVKKHEADMVAVATETPERLEYMRFTAPYVDFPDVIITRSGDSVSSLEELHGRHLLTIKGFGINEFLRNRHPQIELRLVADVKTLLERVSTGEADAGVLNLATTSYAIGKWKIANLHISSQTGFSYKLALASRRDWPMLQRLLQKGIDSIGGNEREVIARKWVGLKSESWKPTREQVVAFAVTLIIVGFGVTLIWNRQLRKTVESRTQELRASEQEFRNLYKTALVGLYRTTIDGTKVLAANPAVASQFGYDSVDTLMEHFSSKDVYVEPGRRETLLKMLRENGRVDNFEFLGRLLDGSVRNFLLSGTLYEDQGYLEGAILDITDRKRAEDEAKVARETAEQANRAKTDFLAAASHDLRQPLHAMSLQIGQLKESLQDEKAEEILTQISNSQFALSDVLNALLDISHLDAGTLKPNFSHFPLAQLFTRLENEFGPQTRERGVELRLRSTRAWLYSDATLLYRVLANLVDNAIKYTAAPGVLIAARKRGDHWRIEIWDCGPGIPAEQQQAIYDEFVQLDNPGRDRRKGLGLGLSIVQRLNQLLGHQLSLISRSGYGSCFRLEVAEGTPLPQQNGEPLSHEERGYRLQGAVVLVVDDDPDVLTATRDLLTGWKCAVLTAASLEEAVAVAADEEIDVIIADYRLADGHTGLEVIEVLNEKQGGKSKAVIITGDVNAEELSRLRDGRYPVLSKPVMPVTLRSTLHQLMVD
ncbi:MAG: transporter substrate-binding domain-containing protein [Gammaproteobacteria bacterium]|nr:transporter substrate-binding domain-containing protein [Gammaproteobacteria bacterium]